jgi:hypothetical protein
VGDLYLFPILPARRNIVAFQKKRGSLTFKSCCPDLDSSLYFCPRHEMLTGLARHRFTRFVVPAQEDSIPRTLARCLVSSIQTRAAIDSRICLTHSLTYPILLVDLHACNSCALHVMIQLPAK